MISRIKRTVLFGERVEKKDPNNPKDFGWITLYDSYKDNPKLSKETLLNKKSVVFFPGDGTNSEKEANGCCKVVQAMLTQAGVQKKDMPHFYGLAYQGEGQDKHRYEVLTKLKQAQFGAEYVPEEVSQDPPYYQPFFDEYILPLIVDKKGKARPVSEIRKNIQNVTFATHCHGGFVADQIERMMTKKLAELYPDEVKELMGNVRMIHFSSRRPKGVGSFGKHLDIISKSDSMYADSSTLEYDDIHKQMMRASLSEPSALIRVSPNEEVLLLNQVTKEESDNFGQDPEHGKILQVFSGEIKNSVPENTPAIELTRQMLRHFVEHPEDKKDVEAQLRDLDASFVDQNIKYGKGLLSQEKEDEKVRRGLLSLFSDWNERWGVRLARGSNNYKKTQERNDLLRQRDDEGRFVYEQLKKQYLKTGDARSLINYIKQTILLNVAERGDLSVLAIQNQDWHLFKSLGGPNQASFNTTQTQLVKIIESVHPDHLYRLFRFLRSASISTKLGQNPDAMLVLMRKIRKIKNVIHKNQMEAVLKSKLENIFYIYKETFADILRQSNLPEKKYLKSLIAKARHSEADKLFSLIRKRNQQAPELSISQMKEYSGIRRQYPRATLQDYREFAALHKKSRFLHFDSFFKEKRTLIEKNSASRNR